MSLGQPRDDHQQLGGRRDSPDQATTPRRHRLELGEQEDAPIVHAHAGRSAMVVRRSVRPGGR